jgi:alpha-1,6-mannosyltransferase
MQHGNCGNSEFRIQNSQLNTPPASHIVPHLALLALAVGLAAIFYHVARLPDALSQTPEVIAWLLAAGILYLAGAFLVERCTLGAFGLAIILAAALIFRWLLLPAPPALSTDVYRYQWEGRVERAGINPYTTYPAALRRLRLEDPEHPLQVGQFIPTLYPPLSEWSFSWVKTVPGYKRLYTGLDVASLGVLLVILAVRKQPLARVVIYAWNPAVVVAFAMCGHHDSLAILALLVANLFIIEQRGRLSILFLALSTLSKFFSALMLPVFLKRTRWVYGLLFAGVVAAAYLPYASAGRKLPHGLLQYAGAWENNDSVFRLLLLAGNTRAQAGLISAVLLAALLLYAMRRRLEPLRASLFLIAGLLLLSPNAFPWYFTWLIPFLCFYPSSPWLLLSVTCVLGYAPVVEYAAGLPYKDSPLMLALEYAPVFAWLAYKACGRRGTPIT